MRENISSIGDRPSAKEGHIVEIEEIDKSYEALEQRIKELGETVKFYKEEIEALRGEKRIKELEAENATLKGVLDPLCVRLGIEYYGQILSTVSALQAENAEMRKAAEKVSKTYYTSGINTMYGLVKLETAMGNLKCILED